MPRPPTFYHPLREIRKETDAITQAEFASLVGVASPTIQAIENGKFEISRKLALRIERATGGDHRELLKGTAGKPLSVDGNKYSRKFYETWIELLNSAPEDSISNNLQQIGFWTRILIQAASSKRKKTPLQSTVVHLLNEALDSVCQDCDLEQSVEALLTPMKRVEYQANTPQEWTEDTDEFETSLGQFPRFHPSAKVIVAIEQIPRWAPGHPIPIEVIAAENELSSY